MFDMTDFAIGLYEQVIPQYVGKEKGSDLTKEDIDKFIEEWWKPFVNESWRRMVGWTDEDTKELEKNSRR